MNLFCFLLLSFASRNQENLVNCFRRRRNYIYEIFKISARRARRINTAACGKENSNARRARSISTFNHQLSIYQDLCRLRQGKIIPNSEIQNPSSEFRVPSLAEPVEATAHSNPNRASQFRVPSSPRWLSLSKPQLPLFQYYMQK